MEITQLKYFLATANCGKIVQAAELLNVSQSTISMSISRLEKELDTTLFIKDGRNITLTEYGKTFQKLIEPAIAQFEFAERQMKALTLIEPNKVYLSIEMPDFATLFEYLFNRKHPDIIFSQSADTREQVLHKILNCTVDFAFTFTPIREATVQSIHLLSEPAYIQVSSSHPLYERDSINLSELSDSNFVSFCNGYGFRHWMDEMCYMAGFTPKTFFEVCDTQSLQRIVLSLNAVTFMGLTTATWNKLLKDPSLLTPQEIHTIPLTNSFCKRDIYLAYNTNRIFSTQAKLFLDFAYLFQNMYNNTASIEDIINKI